MMMKLNSQVKGQRREAKLPFSVLFVFGERCRCIKIDQSLPEKEGWVEEKSFEKILSDQTENSGR